MSNTIKLPDYNSVENLNDTDILLINQSGQNKKVTKEKLLEDINVQIEGVNASLNDNTQKIATNTSDIATLKTSKQDKIVDSGWTALPLADGVVNYENAVFRKIFKTVKCSGRIGGVTGISGTIGTLPSGYRPSKNMTFVCVTNGGVPVSLSLSPFGIITFYCATELTNEKFITLNGVIFDVD